MEKFSPELIRAQAEALEIQKEALESMGVKRTKEVDAVDYEDALDRLMRNTHSENYRNRKMELAQIFVDRYIKPNINRDKLMAASRESNFRYSNGVAMRGGGMIYEANLNTPMNLHNLSNNIKKRIWAHGVGEHIPAEIPHGDRKFFSVNALISILGDGELKGWTSTLGQEGMPVFTTADFLLISDKDSQLIDKNGRLNSLRTVIVNGKYESMIENFRQAFPGVSFRTASQLNDELFERVEGHYQSISDRIDEEIKNEIGGK